MNTDATRQLPTDQTDQLDQFDPPARTVRIVHLVFGVLFLGLAGLWTLSASDVVQFDVNAAVLLPALLILAGAAGLVAMVTNAANNRRTTKGRETY